MRQAQRQSDVSSLPQGCQIARPFMDAEWASFRECAEAGWRSGQNVSNEYYAKQDRHRVPDRQIERTLRSPSARAMVYRYEGGGSRVAVWSKITEVPVIARANDGLVYNAYPVAGDQFERYVSRPQFATLRWLR